MIVVQPTDFRTVYYTAVGYWNIGLWSKEALVSSRSSRLELSRLVYLLDQSFFFYEVEAIILAQQARYEAHRCFVKIPSAASLPQVVPDE